MPTITSTRLEALADTNPELYEVMKEFQDQLNQILPSILSGTDHPEVLTPANTNTAGPGSSGIAAAPGTLYIQRNAGSGPLALHVKDTGYGNTGWAELGAFGSIPPSSGYGFVAKAQPTTITFYYDGTNGSTQLFISRANGAKVPIPPSHTTIIGLVANTTYFFYPYYDERSKSLQWVSGTVGNPAIAFSADSSAAAIQMRLAHRIPLTFGGAITVTTPNAGTTTTTVGGGNGGFGRLA